MGRADARLARAYGAAVLTLPPRQKLLLQLNLPRVKAEEELAQTGGRDLTLEGLHALVKAATGSERAADRAVKNRAAAQMRAGQQPG